MAHEASGGNRKPSRPPKWRRNRILQKRREYMVRREQARQRADGLVHHYVDHSYRYKVKP